MHLTPVPITDAVNIFIRHSIVEPTPTETRVDEDRLVDKQTVTTGSIKTSCESVSYRSRDITVYFYKVWAISII